MDNNYYRAIAYIARNSNAEAPSYWPMIGLVADVFGDAAITKAVVVRTVLDAVEAESARLNKG